MKIRNILASAAALALATQAASATLIGPLFTITAQTADGATATYIVSPPSQVLDVETSSSQWRLDRPMPLTTPDGRTLATLREASFSTIPASSARGGVGPTVVLNFLVTTGAIATNFQVTSANLAFAAINPAAATASASTTVTDTGNDGASLTGLFPGNKAYRALYNSVGGNPGTGTVFASLVNPTAGGNYSSNSTSDTSGPFAPIGAVSSMSAQWQFGIGSNDSASGTSVFVVPTPGAAALAVIAFALSSLRRRTRAAAA